MQAKVKIQEAVGLQPNPDDKAEQVASDTKQAALKEETTKTAHGEASTEEPSLAEQAKETLGEAAHSMKKKIHDAADTDLSTRAKLAAGNVIVPAKDRVQEWTEDEPTVGEQIKHAAHVAYEDVAYAGEKIKEAAASAATAVKEEAEYLATAAKETLLGTASTSPPRAPAKEVTG